MKPWQNKLIKLVSPLLKKLEPDHGIAHSRVVFRWCLIFANDYKKVDMEALFAAAYLHDVGHLKLRNGMGDHSSLSLRLAKPILKKVAIPEEKASLIKQIIEAHEERDDLSKKKLPVEILIFHDADKIDSMGALGISRQFVYSGRVCKKFWDPDIPRNPGLLWGGNYSAMHTILDDIMKYRFYTKEGKKIAEGRRGYMQSFIKRFFQEWDFKK